MADKLHQLLTHESTRDFFGRLARGDDPRRAAADVAGQTIAQMLAGALGAPRPPVEVNRPPATAPQDAPAAKKPADADVVDAEFTVINVTEQARQAKKART